MTKLTNNLVIKVLTLDFFLQHTLKLFTNEANKTK